MYATDEIGDDGDFGVVTVIESSWRDFSFEISFNRFSESNIFDDVTLKFGHLADSFSKFETESILF